MRNETRLGIIEWRNVRLDHQYWLGHRQALAGIGESQ